MTGPAQRLIVSALQSIYGSYHYSDCKYCPWAGKPRGRDERNGLYRYRCLSCGRAGGWCRDRARASWDWSIRHGIPFCRSSAQWLGPHDEKNVSNSP